MGSCLSSLTHLSAALTLLVNRGPITVTPQPSQPPPPQPLPAQHAPNRRQLEPQHRHTPRLEFTQQYVAPRGQDGRHVPFTNMDLGMGMGIDTTDFGLFNPFQFTFEAPSPLPSSESESGGSSGSFSPPPSMRAASVDTGYSASTDDPAAEFANRVRKNAGLVLAVQIGSEPQYQPHQPSAFTAPPAPLYPTPNTAASAFTNTRCPDRTAHARHRSADHDAITAENIAHYHRAAGPHQPQRAHPVAATGRLRAARRRQGGRDQGGRALSRDASDPEDHIDARGYVDGVKIARKRSKANNREKGLTRELEGLKTLLHGLVGVEDEANPNEEDDEEGESDDEGGAGAKVEPAPKVKVERRRSAEGRAPPCVRLRAQVYATCTLSASVGAGLVGKGRKIPGHRVTAAHPSTGDAYVPHARPARCARPHLPRLCPHPPSPMPSPPFPALVHNPTLPSRVQLALGSDAAHAHTHVVSAHAHAMCVRGESPHAPLPVLLARGDARAEFARTHCADKRNEVLLVGNLKGFQFEGFEI
ncbi:hypothetical protein B0H16DRAFT_1823534 [Mycena metata]|uniref:BHLH domain-containing protein n=1 Tax=Mycena metata TaxID=1033252 RepID=A0AAD7MAM3_9AGAR|nr:hypothetical protein B0H16DRAFT_1823534 [Mycena metata]